jgi:phage terminase large subunit GpA-like protein
VTRVVKGYRRGEWQKTRDRNEALDCRAYARAAAAVYGMDLATQADWDRVTAQLEARAKSGSRSNGREDYIPRRRVVLSRYLEQDSGDWD